METGPTEIETKLLIVHKDPEKIAEEISQIDYISGFQLSEPQTKKIHDIYFDTVDEAFRKSRLAFRLRDEDSRQLITVKGKTKIHGWGAVERLEIESTWSIPALNDILSKIRQYGIDIHVDKNVQKLKTPMEILKEIGFRIIQDRQTSRLIREIEYEQDLVAELAIDQVHYQIQEHQLIHYEIEIEAKNLQGSKAIQDIQRDLQSTYGDSLQLSVFSKLMLGMVLKELPDNPKFFDMQKPLSHLTPAAYKWIEEKLKAIHE